MSGDQKAPIAKPKYIEGLGLIEKYLCPRCGSEVKFSYEDDIGTRFYKCVKCGEVSSRPKTPERERLEEALKTCDSRKIVYHYGHVMNDIEKLKDLLTKRALAFKSLPERVIPLVELEDMEKEIKELVTEGIKTCSLKGLIK